MLVIQGAPEKKICHTGFGAGVLVGKGVGTVVSVGKGRSVKVAVTTAVFTLSSVGSSVETAGIVFAATTAAVGVAEAVGGCVT
ncbi:MAG: hypothetical protein M5U34_00275 [Chloroflexi bacterium]|nr:hypothetical protein [Chloroflexota bacterium]